MLEAQGLEYMETGGTAMIKTAKKLVAACLDVANNRKTLYVMGCFGAPMTEKNKTRYINGYAFNRKPEREGKIRAADADTFGFDCVCFIKGLLWGWNGDASQVYGGAQYKSGGVPDMNADAMLKACTEVSEDFSDIQPGELVWLPGHCGIYVGDGLAAEATYEPDEGVQLQCVLPMGVKPGMSATAWIKHGKLPWISYEEATAAVREQGKYRVILDGLNEQEAEAFTDNPKAGWTVQVEQMQENESLWEPMEGDVVRFKGGMQYSQANATVGNQRPAGLAKITKTAPGKQHPWHLVKTGAVGPYGWVDRDSFEKI